MKKTMEAIIEEVVIEPNKIQPIIVNFQNGHLKDEETKNMKCGLYNDTKKNKTVLAMSNGQIVYRGYRPDLSKELTYTMLAIHNKKTGKVRLVQAERWDVAPVLDEHVDNSSNDDIIDKIGALNKQFGSKKVKRRTEQYERMKINVDSVKEQLEKTVSNVEIQRDELEPVAIDTFTEGLHLPPCNREATHESLVYDIYDIVPKNILETMYGHTIEELEEESEGKPKFYRATLEKIKNDPKSELKLALLLYIEAVLKWLHIPMKVVKQNPPEICPYSSEVQTFIFDSYSTPSTSGRMRPPTMKDKGIIHCIIVALTIWNYTLDLELFSTMFTMRLGIRKLQELARWICATQHREDKRCVVLKLPLAPAPAKVLTKRKK